MNKRRFPIIFFQTPFPLVSCMSTLIYNHYQVVYILQNISMFTFCRKMHTASVIMLSLSAISVCLCIMWYYLRFFMQYLCNLSFPLILCVPPLSLSLSFNWLTALPLLFATTVAVRKFFVCWCWLILCLVLNLALEECGVAP